MVIIYLKDATDVNDCHLLMALPHVNSLEEKEGELYAGVRNDPVVSDIARVGWFAVPEQFLPPTQMGEDGMVIIPTIAELNLTYFKDGELEDILNTRTLVELTKEVSELKARVISLEAKRL